MTRPPRLPVVSLPAPPGSFERVLAGAARRRRRRAAAVAATAAVMTVLASGTLALAADLDRSRGVDQPAHSQTPSATPLPHPEPTAAPHAALPLRTARPGRGPGGAAAAAAGGGVRATYLRGRVVDAAGNGIAGIYVQPGLAGTTRFATVGRVAAVTDASGYYSIACPHAPVLVATWPVRKTIYGGYAGSGWGPAFVGGGTFGHAAVPSCGSAVHRTTLPAGGTFTGHIVTTGTACDASTMFGLWLRLGGDADLTVHLGQLVAGSAFTFAGLPPGTHLLGTRNQLSSVTVGAGAVVTGDKVVDCGDVPTPEPSSPSPSATDTASPADVSPAPQP